MYIYTTAPIDFWDGMVPLSDYLQEHPNHIEGLLEAMFEAFRLARQSAGWEGDIRGGNEIYVSGLPRESGDTLLILAWKQDNNGLTFVASPVELPWMAGAMVHDGGSYEEEFGTAVCSPTYQATA